MDAKSIHILQFFEVLSRCDLAAEFSVTHVFLKGAPSNTKDFRRGQPLYFNFGTFGDLCSGSFLAFKILMGSQPHH